MTFGSVNLNFQLPHKISSRNQIIFFFAFLRVFSFHSKWSESLVTEKRWFCCWVKFTHKSRPFEFVCHIINLIINLANYEFIIRILKLKYCLYTGGSCRLAIISSLTSVHKLLTSDHFDKVNIPHEIWSQ